MNNTIKPIIFDFDVFVATESEGEPQEFEGNTSEWIEIQELLQKEKILSNIIVLNRLFIKGLIDDTYNFKMHIDVDEQENVLLRMWIQYTIFKIF